jgi:hypothetical protein
MSDFLFIANDPRILALIENLRPLTGCEIGVEADFSSGISRIFAEHPSVVFLQSMIGSISCEKPAGQVKMLLGKKAIRLALLSDDAVTLHSLDFAFDASFDIALPLPVLSDQVRQLFLPLPQTAREMTASEAEAVQLAETMEFYLPLETEPFGAFPASPDGQSREARPGPLQSHGAPPESAKTPELSDTAGPSGSQGLSELAQFSKSAPAPEFPEVFLSERHRELLPENMESAYLQEQQSQSVPSTRHKTAHSEIPAKDSHRIERENPNQLFGSISSSFEEPDFNLPKPGAPKPSSKNSSAATSAGRKPAQGKAGNRRPDSASSAPQTPPPARVAKSVAATAGGSSTVETARRLDELPGYAAREIGVTESSEPSYRTIFACALVVLCVAAIMLGLNRYHSSNRPAVPGEFRGFEPSPASAQYLQLIPKVAAEAGYGASHPGWECYHCDAVEYLVYREKDQVRAIQVLSEKYGAITLPFLKASVRVATGRELPAAKKTETRNDFQVATSALQNGGEVVVYRKVPDDEIRGFVLSLPNEEPAAPGKEKTKKK